MHGMTQEQIAKAQSAKKSYLQAILALVMISVLGFFLDRFVADNPTVSLGYLGIWVGGLVFGLIATWRFCRAIQIGVLPAILITALAPVSFVIEYVILNRVYSKRTGMQLTFLLGDKPPGQARAA